MEESQEPAQQKPNSRRNTRKWLCTTDRDGKFVMIPWEELGSFDGPLYPGDQRNFGVIGDLMEPMRSPVTGEYFTSKSKYRADLAARGYVEVGNDYNSMKAPKKREVPGRRQTVERAWEMTKQGYKPPPAPTLSEAGFKGGTYRTYGSK